VQQNIHLEVFSHDDVEYGSVLGKGGEGIVQRCKVIYKELPVDAAVKTVLNNSDDALTITLDEIELLWYILHNAHFRNYSTNVYMYKPFYHLNGF